MIRLGLVGCGGIAQSHIAGLTDLPGAKLVATVDLDRQKAEEAAKVLGADKAATDFREIYDDVDAMLLSLPHHLHYPIGMECSSCIMRPGD